MMQKKIILCVLLLLFSFVMPTEAGRKKPRKRTQPKPKTEVRIQEIDNYDFLYTGGEYDDDYYYDMEATEDLMEEAFKHIGARYRSGSKGPNTFDCSGFTSYVYGKMNIQIGASSRDQYARNIPITKSELQTGDLGFFTSPGSGRGVGHVGIVVDVNPNGTFSFIHASSREGVKVSQSTDGYYARRYVGARRVK